MGWMDEYNALKKKRKEEEQKSTTSSEKSTAVKTTTTSQSSGNSWMQEYNDLKSKRLAKEAEEEKTSGKTSKLTTSRGQVASRITAGNLTSEKEEDERKWFQKGVFEDGYQAGDISKAILGTLADVGQDALTGIVGMGESALDAFMTIAPYSLQSSDPFTHPTLREKQNELFEAAKKESAEFVAKDLYDEQAVANQLLSNMYGNFNNVQKLQNGQMLSEEDLALGKDNTKYAKQYIDNQMEVESVLGEKSDALMQSAGVLAAQAGLQAVGVPWYLTSGVTSFGSETENALKQGATNEEAIISGAVSAGAEILTEKMFGGDIFTKNGADLATRYLSREVSNKVVRNLIKAGYDVAGEGFEEAVSQAISRLGSSVYKDEKLKDILFSEEAWDEYIESAVGGMVLGGVMTGINVAKSNAAGVDYTTGLTDNEQKVVDKLYKEWQTEDMDSQEKKQLYDDVLRAMDRGTIDADTISEILDSDSHKAYDSLTKESEEFKTLYNTPFEKLSAAQNARLKELQAKHETKAYEKALEEARNKRFTDTWDMVRGTRLEESFREKLRYGEDFKADFDRFKGSKYEEAARKTLQNAVDFESNGKKLNNTNAMHDVIDLAANISAETGKVFTFGDAETFKKDFINQQTAKIAELEQMQNRTEEDNKRLAKMKEILAKVESGKVKVNGVKTADGITLNLDSENPLEFTVGHEVTHVLKQANAFKNLKDALYSYAKAKGVDIDAELLDRTARYAGIEDADPEEELVCDLVGGYIFSDYDFALNLSTEHRNVAQKIYDEIKHLCKLATAGSKAARELERAKRQFEKAFREAAEASEAKTDRKYSISDKNIKDTSTGYSYGESYYTMSYTQDGKVVGTLEYGEYDGEANVKMIKVEPEYRRKGIATKLMQELQNKYPDTEINFGMATPDGAKLLESITYDVTDEAVVADRQKLKDLQTELNDLQEKLDVLYDTENLTEEQDAELHKLGDRWQEVYETIHELAKDLKGKKATRTYVKTDVKYSLGYHAGDLGKAESYAQQGGSRSTGHFGTGTYFVGDEAKISDGTYGKRPHHSVEFDNYHLYKVRNDDQGYKLHDYLHAIDRGFSKEYLDAAINRKFRPSELRSEAFKLAEQYETKEWDDELGFETSSNYFEASIRAMTEVAEANNVEFRTYDEHLEYIGADVNPDDPDYDLYQDDYYDYLKQTLKEADEERNYNYPRFRDAHFELRWMFGEENVNRALQAVIDHDAAMDEADYDTQRVSDSRATVFMKALGYEGIDVRGTRLDNTTYGSVIYDLKGEDAKRKAENGARYSLSDSEMDEKHFDAVVNRDWETAARMVEEAAKKAGYTKTVYHGTDARFTRFDTDEESTARAQHAWMADYPDGTIFLAEDYDVADGYGERVMELYLDTSDVKVFEEPDMYAHRAMDDKYGYEVYNYPVIAVKGKDMTIYATLDNTLVKSADTVTYGDGGEIIPLSERFKHSNEDIRYSLSDTNGREVSPAVAKRFGNSKAVDEDGNLKVLYHGTASGEFSIFDKARGNVEGDFGSGFYFTDNEADVSEHYEGGGPDFEQKVALLAERIEAEEDIPYDEAKIKAREQLYVGSHKFEVYLNIENPAVVGETYLFDSEFGERYDEEDFDDYDEYVAETEQAVADAIDNIIWEVDRNVDLYSTDGLADVLYEAYYEGGIGIEELKAKINELYLEDSNGNLAGNEVTRQIIESLGYDGIIDPTVSGKWNMDMEEGTTHYIVFKPNQIKAITNENPTDNPDIHRSLSNSGDAPFKRSINSVYGKDVIKQNPFPEIAPVVDESVRQPSKPWTVEEMFPDEETAQTELDNLYQQQESIYGRMMDAVNSEDMDTFTQETIEYEKVTKRIEELENEISETESSRADSLMDEDAPIEMEAPYYETEPTVLTKKATADIVRDVRKSLDLNNPQMADCKDIVEQWRSGEIQTRDQLIDALQDKFGKYTDVEEDYLLQEIKREIRTRGINVSKDIQRNFPDYADMMRRNRGKIRFSKQGLAVDEVYQELNSLYPGYFPMEMHLDNGRQNAADQLERIIEIANTPHSKQTQRNKPIGNIEEAADIIIHGIDNFRLNQDLALSERESRGAFADLMRNADRYTPEDIAPVSPEVASQSKETKPTKAAPKKVTAQKSSGKVAQVLTEASKPDKKTGFGMGFISQTVDKGMAVENLAYETGNEELQPKYQAALSTTTEAKAQYFMENGTKGVKPFKETVTKIQNSGKQNAFERYMYHAHNVDRMSLESKFGIPNKAVYGDSITADVSRAEVAKYEKKNPEFKEWAKEIYAITKWQRSLLVENGIISQETADLWEKMYPHYVPITRKDAKGANVYVPLDTNKTGVNAPIKKAVGGNSDIEPMLNTIAQRIEQTYRAIARNSFGIELKNTLRSEIEAEIEEIGILPNGSVVRAADRANYGRIKSYNESTGKYAVHFVSPSGHAATVQLDAKMLTPIKIADVDEMIDTLDDQDSKLLKPGTMESNPTFTVFENGKRVEFEITEDLFDSLKPANKILAHRFENSDKKVVRGVGKALEARRNLLTNWNPVFAWYRNPVKDIQDVAINSQHPIQTYVSMPKAVVELWRDGKWATEYHENGGKSNTFFDNRKNEFVEEKGIKKLFGKYEAAGEFIEEVPRLAEYIASRMNGRSVERSMLDAARVTTNFTAGGDFTKFLNSHGFTFLNASVQGASQHVRNFRESYHTEGAMGVVKTLAKYVVAGVPTIVLNSLRWDDDEEYEELNDYVKQNYYVLWKTDEGKFFRVPKGRTAAVMGELMQQMENLVTGDDEADFSTFFELFMNNIAPSNPLENNIIAPIGQVMSNTAWYGGDLVPARLQKLPAEEQYDESTDILSRKIGEATGTSPYKWNYLIDQYSGGLGDVFLPMMTPEAESGDNSFMGNILAPWKKEMTTDSVLNNKNPGDFYDLKDELEIKSNSSKATEEDKMRSTYMDSVSWEMSDLYKLKRNAQNSALPDSVKYENVRQIQEQINALAENALNHYNHVSIDGMYSEAGDKRYNKDAESGKWYEIKPKNADGTDNWYYQKEQKVTKALGISYGEYWNNREEYNYAYDKPEQYALSQAVGGYESYRKYTSSLYDIKADKDKNGKSISGSRKTKVINYLNDLDIDYYHKIMLFKSEYNADDTYNYEIIDYLNGRDDISYSEMEMILKYLGFNVDSKGNITWD